MEIEHSECIKKAYLSTNKIISHKKLQFNYIWTTKITQEDISIPTQLNDLQKNQALTKNILLSIIKFANKVNNTFENIFFNADKHILNENQLFEEISEMMVVSVSILKKMKNFLEIKTKQFKINKFVVEPLTVLQRYFGLFKHNVKKEEISTRISEIHSTVTEFNDMLILENHLF